MIQIRQCLPKERKQEKEKKEKRKEKKKKVSPCSVNTSRFLLHLT